MIGIRASNLKVLARYLQVKNLKLLDLSTNNISEDKFRILNQNLYIKPII